MSTVSLADPPHGGSSGDQQLLMLLDLLEDCGVPIDAYPALQVGTATGGAAVGQCS
jgi:hypothetical protein